MNVMNQEGQRECCVTNALEADEGIDFSESADGWFKISPYGVFPGKTPGRMQHVTPDGCAAMVEEVQALRKKQGKKFRGIPIYRGHPDVDPTVWTDDRRLGKVLRVECRGDGLWGYAEWNTLGEDNKREGWWIYPSPRWDAPAGQAQMVPDRLISIGLTNTPRIVESEPIFNSNQEKEELRQGNEDNQMITMDPKLIRKKLGLPEAATDEEVLAKIDSLMTAESENEKEKAKAKAEGEEGKAAAEIATELATVKEEKTEVENALRKREAEVARVIAAHNADLLADALVSGRISKAERAAWEAKLNGVRRMEEVNALQKLIPKWKTGTIDVGDRRGERAQVDDLREEVSNAVAKLQKDEGLTYAIAWAKVKKKPEFQGYFTRVQPDKN